MVGHILTWVTSSSFAPPRAPPKSFSVAFVTFVTFCKNPSAFNFPISPFRVFRGSSFGLSVLGGFNFVLFCKNPSLPQVPKGVTHSMVHFKTNRRTMLSVAPFRTIRQSPFACHKDSVARPILFDRFCLPPAKSGRRLVAMRRTTPLGVSAGSEAREFGRTELGFGPAGSLHASPVRTRGETPVDTFHCSSDVAGSAVQFNSSVSAMPDNPTRTFATPPHPGTADTLLLR